MSDETAETWEAKYKREKAEELAEHRAFVTKYEAERDARHQENAKERDRAVNAMNDVRADRMLREQVAATLLAAFIQAHATANARNPEHAVNMPADYADKAVAMADALRAALESK